MGDSLVINIGDTMMRWTNDRWISTRHRVVNPPREVAAGARRISLPVFFNANDDAILECLPNCSSVDNPPKYPPVIAGEYRREKLERSYNYARLKGEATT
jgi:isopenicillin N synthase-like dioxygenase